MSMLPVIALVGRPNVGKSTLFNCLTKTRDAIVADQPGLTRDRNYGRGQVGDRPYIVVDTGGISGDDEGIDGHMAKQSLAAIDEADLVLFMVDAKAGLTPGDMNIAKHLRQCAKPVVIVVNKIDGIQPEVAEAEFHSLGISDMHGIAAAHNRGINQLMMHALTMVPQVSAVEMDDEDAISIAIVGRPNVGKSTLVNRILGEERVVVFDMPGTTRDSIRIPFEREGEPYILIDTAGVRRRGKVDEGIEKFSVIKTLQAIEGANVVIQVFDAREGITDQDAHLLGFALESGRALVLAVNKWDGMKPDQRDRVKEELARKLVFINFAKIHFISALHGSGVGNLFDSVQRAYKSAMSDLPTPKLTRLLEDCVAAHQPPLVHGRRVKLRYAHQGGKNPPIIIIHGNQTDAVPEAYKRYLINMFRKALKLEGTPMRVEFKSGTNPYEGRRNQLTPRQIAKRQRLVRFTKKK